MKISGLALKNNNNNSNNNKGINSTELRALRKNNKREQIYVGGKKWDSHWQRKLDHMVASRC